MFNMKKNLRAGLAPHRGLMSMLQGGDVKSGMGDMLFGHDPLYGNYLKKQFGMAPPPEDIIVPGGGEYVGMGDYSQGMGASNPYGALRARGF